MSQPNIFYKKGDVVYAPFPYSEDPSIEKDRPVVLLAPTNTTVKGFICAYITTQEKPHRAGIVTVNKKDFKEGGLEDYKPSYVHPHILYTVSLNVIREKKGTLNDEVVETIVKMITELLQQSHIPKALERPKKKVF